MRAKRKRTHRVEVAMNDKEYQKFLEHVHECGVSKQAYLLCLISQRIPQPKPNKDFYDMVKQLRKIGNNLNQLCIVANKTGNIEYHQIRYALDDLNKNIVQIRSDVLLPRKADSDGND